MYDFIIVGAGPAGACLASRLARTESQPKVLLLEAGGSNEGKDPNILSERWSSFMLYPDQNWGYQTVPQKHLNDRQIDYSRGKGLGGSTAINMCTYTVGPKDDYERWAEEVGDAAFNWQNALRKRQNIESWDTAADKKYADPDMKLHGSNGPVRIEYAHHLEEQLALTIQAAKDAKLEFGYSEDGNDGNALGFSLNPTTSKDGRRIDAAAAYLIDVPSNLEIITDAQVTTVIISGSKATGVVANDTQYYASKDVVLSAGAVDSPKILMLSGIGDRDELAKFDIEVISNLPGVGSNLQDHFFVPSSWKVKDGLSTWKNVSSAEDMKRAREEFLRDETGPLRTMFSDLAMGYFKADNALQTPEFASLPKHVQDHIKRPTVPLWEMTTGLPSFSPLQKAEESYLTCPIFAECPQSWGTIRLASKDPKEPPLIDPNFFSHPFDKVVAVEAGRKLLDFVESPGLKEIIIEPLTAPAGRSEEEILTFWTENGMSTWHPCCTVKMGRKDDEMTCVDSDFRIYGVENLRVVDMSVMPFIPSCHLQAFAYLIGETAAEKMIAEYDLEG